MGRIPFGFNSLTEFQEFGKILYSSFKEAGFDDVTAIMQGSAATGKSYEEQKIFSDNSDFDIAVVSPSLFKIAKQAGLKVWGKTNHPRILLDIEYNYEAIEELGLADIESSLREKAGRPVNFMIYESENDAIRKAENSAFQIGIPNELANIPIPKS